MRGESAHDSNKPNYARGLGPAAVVRSAVTGPWTVIGWPRPLLSAAARHVGRGHATGSLELIGHELRVVTGPMRALVRWASSSPRALTEWSLKFPVRPVDTASHNTSHPSMGANSEARSSHSNGSSAPLDCLADLWQRTFPSVDSRRFRTASISGTGALLRRTSSKALVLAAAAVALFSLGAASPAQAYAPGRATAYKPVYNAVTGNWDYHCSYSGWRSGVAVTWHCDLTERWGNDSEYLSSATIRTNSGQWTPGTTKTTPTYSYPLIAGRGSQYCTRAWALSADGGTAYVYACQ